MTKKNHYPYPDQRIYDDRKDAYNNLWKKIFPEQYLEKMAQMAGAIETVSVFSKPLPLHILREQSKKLAYIF